MNYDDNVPRMRQLEERVAALEAANVPPPDLVDSGMQAMEFSPLEYTRHPAYRTAAEWRDKHDAMAERASGLERELGSVLERLRIAEADVGIQQRKCGDQQATISSYRTMLENATAEYATQYKRAEANQVAADTLKDLRCGKAVRLDDEELWLTCIAPTQISKWQAAADTLERLKRGLGVVLADFGGSPAWLTCHDPHEISRWFKEHNTLERLQKGETAEISEGKLVQICTPWTAQQWRDLRAERDALAAKVAELEKRLEVATGVGDGSLYVWAKREELNELHTLRLQCKYEPLIPSVVESAKQCGYAIAIHGSLQRDADLIAVPWTCDASDADVLIDALCVAVGGVLRDPKDRPPGSEYDPSPKPHGRRAWSIHVGGGAYFDVSVTPRHADEPSLFVAQHAAEVMTLECEKLQAAKADLERRLAIQTQATIDVEKGRDEAMDTAAALRLKIDKATHEYCGAFFDGSPLVGCAKPQFDAMKRDAERWRWVYDSAIWMHTALGRDMYVLEVSEAENLDASVDLAIAAEKEAKT